MARYIDEDDLKAVIKANDWSNPAVPDVVGIIIDRTPTADVVPKSEYDAVVSAVDNSTKEFLKLHDYYQEAKSEVEYWKQQYFRSCVSNGCADEKFIEYLRTNSEVHNDPVGEDGVDGLESAITQAKAEVAIDILREIDNALSKFYCYEYGMVRRYIPPLLIELKKKYTEDKS